MSGEIEGRAFRTWVGDTRIASVRTWGLISRYMAQRYMRTWYTYMVMVLALFGALIGLVVESLSFNPASLPLGADPNLYNEGVTSFTGLGMVLFGLLITAPAIAEDIRFNAQLFFFSKPMHVGDYLLGKTIFCLFGLMLVGLVPALVLGLNVLSTGPGDAAAIIAPYEAGGPLPDEAKAEILADWRFSGVDSWKEAWYLAGMPVLAVVSLAVGWTGMLLAISSFTRRAWHAAVGAVVLVMGWGVLADIATMPITSSRQYIYDPMGWAHSVVWLPIKNQFRPSECRTPDDIEGSYGYCDYVLDPLVGADTAILAGHALLWLAGVLGFSIAWMRLKRLEGAA